MCLRVSAIANCSPVELLLKQVPRVASLVMIVNEGFPILIGLNDRTILFFCLQCESIGVFLSKLQLLNVIAFDFRRSRSQ